MNHNEAPLVPLHDIQEPKSDIELVYIVREQRLSEIRGAVYRVKEAVQRHFAGTKVENPELLNTARQEIETIHKQGSGGDIDFEWPEDSNV